METPSRTAVLSAAAVVLGSAACAPALGFALGAPGASSSLRAHGAAPGAQAPQELSSSTMVMAACGATAIASTVASSKRRARTATAAAHPKHMLVAGVRGYEMEWQPIPGDAVKYPKPNSEEMFKTMIGADVETGGEAWDPLGFHKLFDRNFDFNMLPVYPHVQWLREAEIKHGRVCMLAFIGCFAQAGYHIGSYPVQPDWSKALAECYASPTGAVGLFQISVLIGWIEGKNYNGDAWVGMSEKEPGDLGFDPAGFTKNPDFDLKKAQLQEIKNGRLAMVGCASIAANHFIPGSVPLLTGFYAVKPEQEAARTGSSFCGKTMEKSSTSSKTAAKYTTQVILPSLTWLKSGVSAGELAPGELRAVTLGGNDVLLGKTEGGSLFGVSNLCPHIGTPLSEGADIVGDIIVCPLHGSSWNVNSGELIDWCVSPPIIGPVTGFLVEKKNIFVFDVRTGLFGTGEIEVQVDTNAKKAYEADYWKGVLDAQGKNDGTYY
ncbi:Photosystem I chain G with nirD domain [Amphidinium carterae]